MEGQQHELLERAKAIELGATTYFTGKPCKNGHVARRYVMGSTCAECARQAADREKDRIRARRQALKLGAAP